MSQPRDSINLYISAARAMIAAEEYLANDPPHSMRTYSIVAATMKDEDGTVDHGFKARIETLGGGPSFFL